MGIDLGDAFRSGVQDLFSVSGLLVYCLLLLYGFGNLVIQQSLTIIFLRTFYKTLLPAGEPRQQALSQIGSNQPFAIDVVLPALLGLLVVALLVNELLRLVAIRLFGSDSEEPIPFADVREGFGGAAAKALVVGGGFAIVTSLIGFVPLLGQLAVLVLNGIFVYLRQEIALGESGYVETITNSFSLFMEDPLPILAALIVLGIAGIVVTIPLSVLIPDPVISNTASQLVGTVFSVLGIAVVTDAYTQVKADRASEF